MKYVLNYRWLVAGILALFLLSTAAILVIAADPDADADGIDDVQEDVLGTDPQNPDSDGDGWVDGEDETPVSRLFLPLDDARFQGENDFSAPLPDWITLVSHQGGTFGSDGWMVSPEASLSLFLAPSEPIGPSGLVVQVSATLQPGSVLSASWLIDGVESPETIPLGLAPSNALGPVAVNETSFWTPPAAAQSRALLIRASGTADAPAALTILRAYLDADQDGLDADQEQQVGTSDTNRDSDGDGIDDWTELQYGLNPADPSDANLDLDADGLTNLAEIQAGSNPATHSARDGGLPGRLLAERWTGINGRNTTKLKKHERFPATPDETTYLDTPATPNKTGNRYGLRLRGTLTAFETGAYTFHIAGDDKCDLYLSTDATPFNRQLIARVTRRTRLNQWNKHKAQTSKPITLTAGESYYLEVIQKEHTGGDHLAVAWTRPDNVFEILPAKQLHSHALHPADQNDNGLPDDWEAFHNLPPAAHSHADTDGDGLSNLTEYQRAMNPTNPLDSEGVAGHLTYQRWDNIEGTATASLTGNALFQTAAPNKERYIRPSEFPRNIGDNYGVRLRGQLIPPATGEYTFHISGDDGCDLWLSENPDPFLRDKIASVPEWTHADQWNKTLDQTSGRRLLTKNRAYYIEIHFKEGGGQDHLALAWTRPGPDGPLFELIPDSAFRSHIPPVGDADDDGLPDAWERALGLDSTSAAGDDGSYGDKDQNGLTNHQEFQLGLHPASLDEDTRNLPGQLHHLRWDHIPGLRVAELLQHPNYYAPPAYQGFLDALELQSGDAKCGHRIHTTLTAPTTGDYIFWIAGDDDAHLYLSTDHRPFNRRLIAQVYGTTGFRQWTKHAAQRSRPVALVAGQSYYIEALSKQHHGAQHVSVAWNLPHQDGTPGGGFQRIPAHLFTAPPPDADDADRDGFPDTWETANGLDPTTPNDPTADTDGDWLTDLEEWQWGTAANHPDTDRDGFTDYDEIHVLQTLAATADVHDFIPLATLPGADYTATDGAWVPFQGTARLQDIDGSIDYTLTTTQPGVHLLTAHIASLTPAGESLAHELILTLNGDSIAYDQYTLPPTSAPVPVRALTPWLTPGTHTLRIHFQNSRPGRAIAVHHIDLAAAAGPADPDNIPPAPNWVTTRLHDLNNLTHPDTRLADLQDTYIQALVSPHCQEGRARYRNALTITPAHPVHPLPNERWYADIPLNPAAPVAFTATFENGALTASRQIEWVPLNLLAADPALTIRPRDELLLTAHTAAAFADRSDPDIVPGTVTITIEEDTRGPIATHTHTIGEHLRHAFTEPGTYTLTGTFDEQGEQLTGTVRLTVAAYDTGNAPFLLRGQIREWNTAPLPDALTLEFDDRLTLLQTIETQTPTPGLTHALVSTDIRPAVLAVRVGDNGPVLSTTLITTLNPAKGADTAVRIADIAPDGVTTLEMPFTLGAQPPPDFRIELQLFAPDITFTDGSKLINLTAADFDETGTALVTFLRAAHSTNALCYRTTIYQGDTLIGYYD